MDLSIESFSQVNYKIRNDLLITSRNYNWYGPHNSARYTTEVQRYEIIKMNRDTIILIQKIPPMIGNPKGEINTLFFVKLEKLRTPINNFNHLKMDYGNIFGGSVSISIDSLGAVSFQEYPIIKNDNGVNVNLHTGKFLIDGFIHFKDVLSISLLTKLPLNRGCGIDATETDFTLVTNGTTFINKGCQLYFTQGVLLRYLKTLLNNNDVVWLN